MAYKNPADKREWRKQYRARFPQKHAEWKSAERQRIDARVCGAHVDAWNAQRKASVMQKATMRAEARRAAAALRAERKAALARFGVAECTRCGMTYQARKHDGWCGSCISGGQRKRLTRQPWRRAAHALRCSLKRALRFHNVTTTGSVTAKYMGCTPSEARAYIEQQMHERMTWGNYGVAWHIDHVHPISSFDMTKEEDRARAFHYTNLRPMWARANIRKGANITVRAHQPMLVLGA